VYLNLKHTYALRARLDVNVSFVIYVKRLLMHTTP